MELNLHVIFWWTGCTAAVLPVGIKRLPLNTWAHSPEPAGEHCELRKQLCCKPLLICSNPAAEIFLSFVLLLGEKSLQSFTQSTPVILAGQLCRSTTQPQVLDWMRRWYFTSTQIICFSHKLDLCFRLVLWASRRLSLKWKTTLKAEHSLNECIIARCLCHLLSHQTLAQCL